MIKSTITFFFIISSLFAFGQIIDKPFSTKKMKKDLSVFKEIRQKANSGLYKYRTKKQIDSIYNWADKEIEKSKTYLDFYNIICHLTDYEGSLHNSTLMPKKYQSGLKKENFGYFPYPIKWVAGKWRVNFKNGTIPLGAEIVSINNIPISKIIVNLYKYYTTDGINTTGKRIGIRGHFAKYFRLNYGQKENFIVKYKEAYSDLIQTKTIHSVSYSAYYKNVNNRYSKPYDQIYYADLDENQKYLFKQIDSLSTGILTIHSFSMGNETTKTHKKYVAFLDSVFIKIKKSNLKNLIVDIRQNGGGTDPNDVITFSYLTSRNFQESKQVWISFQKIPLLRYYNSPIPTFLRPFGVGKYNRYFQKRFSNEKNGKYFMNKNEDEMKTREPNKNRFTGNIFLLTSPAVASAGSLFGAMVTGNPKATTIGEETMGGYYGHNGHNSLEYVLPKSKIVIEFSIDNIEQDVPKKKNQIYNRGIIPDFEVSQSYEDFLLHNDTQMTYVLKLIKDK